MRSSQLLLDAFSRVREVVHHAVADLSVGQLERRLDDDGNSIAWLLWHLTRIQDDHVADAAGLDQVWTSQGWARRFALPFSAADTGYGHSSNEVAQVRVASADLLTGYHDAVNEQTDSFVRGLKDPDFDRIVDRSWDPPVSLGVRLVSVVADTLQHAGQAALIRGVLLREGR